MLIGDPAERGFLGVLDGHPQRRQRGNHLFHELALMPGRSVSSSASIVASSAARYPAGRSMRPHRSGHPSIPSRQQPAAPQIRSRQPCETVFRKGGGERIVEREQDRRILRRIGELLIGQRSRPIGDLQRFI